jgi:hypothetical protein
MGEVFNDRARFLVEATRAGNTFNGAYQTLSTLTQHPVILIIQNDTNSTVTLSDDGATAGLTLIAGARLVLDLRGSTTRSNDFSWHIGTTFYVNGTAGSTGTYRMSILYGA